MALDIAGIFFVTALVAKIFSDFEIRSDYADTAQAVFLFLTIVSLIVSAKVRGTVLQDKDTQM